MIKKWWLISQFSLFFALFSVVSVPSFAFQTGFQTGFQTEFQTIYIVRHGEKVDESRDPELSAQGQQRAERLAFHLRDAQVARIYVTEFKRTLLTAQKLAIANHITPQVVAAKETSKLISLLQAESSTALVVGHSNTIAGVLNGLGIHDAKEIADDEFDKLMVIVLSKTEKPIMHVLRY